MEEDFEQLFFNDLRHLWSLSLSDRDLSNLTLVSKSFDFWFRKIFIERIQIPLRKEIEEVKERDKKRDRYGCNGRVDYDFSRDLIIMANLQNIEYILNSGFLWTDKTLETPTRAIERERWRKYFKDTLKGRFLKY